MQSLLKVQEAFLLCLRKHKQKRTEQIPVRPIYYYYLNVTKCFRMLIK